MSLDNWTCKSLRRHKIMKSLRLLKMNCPNCIIRGELWNKKLYVSWSKRISLLSMHFVLNGTAQFFSDLTLCRIIYCIITRHKITQDISSLSQKTVHMISRADIVCFELKFLGWCWRLPLPRFFCVVSHSCFVACDSLA